MANVTVSFGSIGTLQGQARPKLTHEERRRAKAIDVSLREQNAYKDNVVVGKETKVVIAFETGNNGAPVVLSFKANPKITKGSNGFSNSTLYDVMEKLALLQSFEEYFKLMHSDGTPLQQQELVDFLKSHMVGKFYEIEIKNIQRGTDKEFSVVGKIVRQQE